MELHLQLTCVPNMIEIGWNMQPLWCEHVNSFKYTKIFKVMNESPKHVVGVSIGTHCTLSGLRATIAQIF